MSQAIQASQAFGRRTWTQYEVDKIVEWFSYRNEAGIPINYNKYTTQAHKAAADCMLRETGLNTDPSSKEARKTGDKMASMVKVYKQKRAAVQDQTGWGVDELFEKHPIVNPDCIVESGQELRGGDEIGGFRTLNTVEEGEEAFGPANNTQILDDLAEDEGFGEGFGEVFADDENGHDNSSTEDDDNDAHSVTSLAGRAEQEEGLTLNPQLTTTTTNEGLPVSATAQSASVIPAGAPLQTPTGASLQTSAGAPSQTPSRLQLSAPSIVPSRAVSRAASQGASSTKRGKSVARELEVEENEPKRFKRSGNKLSVADSMVEQANIAAKSKKEELLMLTTKRQRYHEAELRQRDHHHAEQMIQHQTVLTKAESQMLTQKERLLRMEQDLEEKRARRAQKEQRQRASDSEDDDLA